MRGAHALYDVCVRARVRLGGPGPALTEPMYPTRIVPPSGTSAKRPGLDKAAGGARVLSHFRHLFVLAICWWPCLGESANLGQIHILGRAHTLSHDDAQATTVRRQSEDNRQRLAD